MSIPEREYFSNSFIEFEVWWEKVDVLPFQLIIPQERVVVRRILGDFRYRSFDFYPGIEKIEAEAERFAARHGLQPYIEEACEIIKNILDLERISGWEINLRIARDIESPYWRALSMIVEVPIDNYSAILDIWTKVGKQFYAELNPDVAKKVYLIFRKKKEEWYRYVV